MKIYRIYTEDKNPMQLRGLVVNMFPECTIYHAEGYYHSLPEPALIIEIISARDIEKIVRSLAGYIKHMNAQQEVKITIEKARVIDI